MLDIPAQHRVQFQKHQLAFLERSDCLCEQAKAYQVLQLFRCLVFVIQDVGGELREEGCKEEADGIEYLALLRGEALDAVIHAGIERALALGVFQAGWGLLFGLFQFYFDLFEKGCQIGH